MLNLQDLCEKMHVKVSFNVLQAQLSKDLDILEGMFFFTLRTFGVFM